VRCSKYRISAADSEGFHPQRGHAAVIELLSSDKKAILLPPMRALDGPRDPPKSTIGRARPRFDVRELSRSLLAIAE
jgi:hypothetical protein